MKLSKTHLHQTLRNMVAASTLKTGNKLMKDLNGIKSDIGLVLQDQANQALPEVTQERQQALLQSRILSPVTISNTTVKVRRTDREKDWDNHTFGRYTWSPSKSDKVRTEQAAFLQDVHLSWANSRAASLSYGNYYCYVDISSSFPQIPDVGVSKYVYPLDAEQWTEGYNSEMLKLHKKAVVVNTKVCELLLEAVAMFDKLVMATFTCTTVEKLLEFIPEAEKHLPEEVRAAKPTKQVADPKVINDIRAKLAAGLPV